MPVISWRALLADPKAGRNVRRDLVRRIGIHAHATGEIEVANSLIAKIEAYPRRSPPIMQDVANAIVEEGR